MNKDYSPKLRNGKSISTYAIRIARMHYLMHHFPEGNLVLDIERQLVQMAESELKEHLLKSASKGICESRIEIEKRIKDAAEARISHLTSDRSMRDSIVKAMRSSDMSEVLSGLP